MRAGTFYDIAAQHSLEVWLYYNSSDTLANINTSSSRDFGQGSRMLIRESEAYGILTDFDRSLDFVYDLELQLTECRKTSQSSSSAALVQHASFGEVSAVSSDKSSAFIIHATKYDLADPPAFLAFPADEQCIALSGSRTASLGASLTGQASKGNRRRRLQANASTPFGNYTYSRNATCQPQELWEASLAAYEGNSTDEEREAESGWKTWRSCKYDNAFARYEPPLNSVEYAAQFHCLYGSLHLQVLNHCLQSSGSCSRKGSRRRTAHWPLSSCPLQAQMISWYVHRLASCHASLQAPSGRSS
eukprot:4484766-Pleurochrysis_carterae.AAC.3